MRGSGLLYKGNIFIIMGKKSEDNTNKTKNILLINHYAGDPNKGMEFRPYYMAKEWVKLGYEVRIIAADFSHL
ncbi:MAG: hypothetical protein CSB16_02600, partial [Clostridiales bacterium]